MTLSQRLEKIKEDWIVIVISLLAAVFLYVFYQIIQLDTATFSVPISVETNGNLLLVKDIPTRVKLTVKGKTEDISRLSEKDFSAYLNLDYYTVPGNYSVPVSLVTSQTVSNLTSLEIRPNPQNINVVLDEKAIGYVPVLIRTAGKPASGYEISGKETNPKYIRIIGSSSSVAAAKIVETELWDIEGAKETIEKTLKLVNANKRISIDEPTSVDAKIIISEIMEDKVFENTTITLLSPTDGLEASSQNLKATVTVNGTQKFLENYKLPYGCLYVDCSTVTEPGEYQLEVKNHKLSNISLVSIEPSTITVTITKKAEELETQEEEEISAIENIEDIENDNPSETENQDSTLETTE